MFAVTFVVAGGSLVVIALVISFVFLRQRDRRLQARAIKRLGFGVSAVFSVLAGLFITGEAFEEPGGIGAVSLVLAWVIPLVLARLGRRSAQVSPRGSGGAVLGSQQQRGT